ncbi:MAG: hypothetical protein J6J43_08430 [Oscillospiraceae bacterium]|nr:hypothetical protein [Oscillospiraceae bacterium]
MIWIRRKAEFAMFIVVALLVIFISIICASIKQPDLQLTVETIGEMRNPGDIVTVDVTMTGNADFGSLSSFEAYIDYDRSRLKLISVDDAATMRNGDVVPYLPDAQVTTELRERGGEELGYISAVMTRPLTEPMLTLFSLTFHVLSMEEGEAEICVVDEKFTGTRLDGEECSLSVRTTDGAIPVSDLLCEHRNTSDYYDSNGDKTHSVKKICICGEDLSSDREDCIDLDADTLCDGCKAQIVSIDKIKVSGSNMALGNELQINFIIPNTLPNDGSYTAYITQTSGNDEEVALIEVPQSEWSMFDGAHRRISVRVRAMEMADQLTMEIKDKDGYSHSEPYATSVQAYAASVLQAVGVSAYMKTLAVDMLNYGAAAQKHFNYNTQRLATSVLTDAQKVLGSSAVECVDHHVTGLNNVGSNLVLDDCILLNMFFDGLYGKNVANMYATVSFTNFQGEEKSVRIEGKEFEQFGLDGDRYRVTIDDIVLADARSLVTVNLYFADGTLHGYGSDSVESYAARGAETESAPLYDAIMRFAVSAYNYLTS